MSVAAVDGAGTAIRVFLVDDHELLRRGLRDALAAAGIDVVGECGRAGGAARRIVASHPDVAILDVRLPDGSGVDVLRSVRATEPSIKGLMLTTFDDERAEAAALLAGASGFLVKQIASHDLVAAVRAVAAGRHPPGRTRAATSRAGDVAARLTTLSAQERRVLALIAEGLTNRQIGERLAIRENTVKNYVTSVLAKLGLERRTQAAVLGAQVRAD